MAIPANTLMEEGKCYMCFGELSTAQILELALLRRIVLAADPAADVSPQGLISTTNCYACLGLSMFDLMLLALLSLLAGEDLPCGTVTTTIQFNAPSGGYDGQYVESSATLWLQTTPSADYGIRLVAGVWEVLRSSSRALWSTQSRNHNSPVASGPRWPVVVRQLPSMYDTAEHSDGGVKVLYLPRDFIG